MSDEQIRLHFQVLQQQIAMLQKKGLGKWKEVDVALEDLQVIYEQMQTTLEAAELVEEELFRQNQQLAERYYHYYDLFQSLPIAYLVTDADGVILEANQASAQLLNVPQRYLAGKPLALYVAKSDRSNFGTKLNQLSQSTGTQIWQTNFCPRKGEPFVARLNVAIACNINGQIETLRIGVYNLNQSQQKVTQIAPQHSLEESRVEATIPLLPQSLDGLQVLIVDDEADIRDFIASVLEPYGVRVTAVATATAALEALEQFHPDVLISDIRMPQEDGYKLIRKVRELEAQQGWHIPAAALTAYLDESREKVLGAGFEAYLHKLAQPTKLIEMVAQLARQSYEL